MQMITDIFHPQFNIAALPLKYRSTPLHQLFSNVGVLITQDEFLSILDEWFTLIEVNKLGMLVK